MPEETYIVRIGQKPVEVRVGDEVQLAADLPGVWLRVVRFGPVDPQTTTPVVFLRASDGREIRSVAGAIVEVRPSKRAR